MAEQKQTNSEAILHEVVEKTMDSFRKLESCRKDGDFSSINFDLEVATDRKSAIAIKGLLAISHLENTANKKLEMTKP